MVFTETSRQRGSQPVSEYFRNKMFSKQLIVTLYHLMFVKFSDTFVVTPIPSPLVKPGFLPLKKINFFHEISNFW